MEFKFELIVYDEDDNIVIREAHEGSVGYCQEMMEMAHNKINMACKRAEEEKEQEILDQIEEDLEDQVRTDFANDLEANLV